MLQVQKQMEKHHPNDRPEINENEGNCLDVGSWWGHAAAGNSVFLLEAFITACKPEVEERHVGRESSDIRKFKEWKR